MKCGQGAMPPTDMMMVQAVMHCLVDYMQMKISTEANQFIALYINRDTLAVIPAKAGIQWV